MKRFVFLGLAGFLVFGTAVSGSSEILTMPESFGSVRAYPNPWRSNQHTGIQMTFDNLPASAVTTLRIFTIAGEQVRTLSGTQAVQWDMRNDRGENVASGIYLYLLTANGQQKTGKIAVIR